MNINGIINMIVRTVVNRGISKGINIAANRGKSPSEMTPQERDAARSTRKNTHSARRGLRILRRFMRF